MTKEPLLKDTPKRILIPRFDTLGDIILLEGFLEALLEKFPDAEIVIVVQKVYYQLKSLFPERIKWLTTNANPFKEPNIDEVDLLLNKLADKHWDLILTTTFNRTYIDDSIALKLKDVRNIAIGDKIEIPWYIKHMWHKLGLSGNLPSYEFVLVAKSLHETEKYRILWKGLTGNGNSFPKPRLIIRDNLKEQAKHILSNLELDKKDFYICAPTGIMNNRIKAWPEERFSDVIIWLEKEHNLQALLVGHEKEKKKVENVAIFAKDKGSAPLVWLGKDGEIPILAAITQKAKLYFGNDTSTMHIAATLGVPVVGLFGGGHWPRFLPTGSHSIGIAGKLPCFECNWDCIFEDAPCLRLVGVDDAKSAIKNVIQGEGLDSNMVRSSHKVSNETIQYIEKAVNKFKSTKSDLIANLDKSESDRVARLEVINEIQKKYEESEADRAARLEVIKDLQEKYEESEADRAARLEVINEIQKKYEESEADRAARLEVIKDLQEKYEESETDRAARLEVIKDIQKRYEESEKEIKRQLEELDQLRSCLESIKSSRSWRMTAPFRKFFSVWRR